MLLCAIELEPHPLLSSRHSSEVHQQIPAPDLEGRQSVVVLALVSVEPALRVLHDFASEKRLFHGPVHGALVAEQQFLVGLEVAVRDDRGEEFDRPLVDPHEEDAVVQAVPVVRVDQVRFLELGLVRRDEDLDGDVGV
jgi:hypothetical protein